MPTTFIQSGRFAAAGGPISLVGTGASATSTNSTATAPLPVGYASAVAGDVGLLFYVGLTAHPATPSGWSIVQQGLNGGVRSGVFVRAFTGSDSIPAIQCTTDGITVGLSVWSGVDNTTPIDATSAATTGSDTYTPASVTTTTADAVVLNHVATNYSVSNIRFNSANGFTLNAGANNYVGDNGFGQSFSTGQAYKSVTTATSYTAASYLSDNDGWIGFSFALREA